MWKKETPSFKAFFHGKKYIIYGDNAGIGTENFTGLRQVKKNIVNIHTDVPIFFNGIISLNIRQIGFIIHLSPPMGREFHNCLVPAHLVHRLHNSLNIRIDYRRIILDFIRLIIYRFFCQVTA